jgi:predicted acylesterase/phospholipase RssA
MVSKSKTALVLAGGGLTGTVYEIGALRAIDDLLIDLSVNDFDIYVGTSAGALVNAFLANGLTPEELFGVLDGTSKEFDSIKRKNIFRLNRNDYFNWGLQLPSKLFLAWSNYLRQITDITLFDFIWSMGEMLPAGFYDSLGLENYLDKALNSLGYSNNFNDLSKELYIIATDLDNGQRAVFGPGHLDVPISLAVAASSALPIVYKPVKIGEREYIDGGFRGTASIDLAIERGAKLIVCINPLVPYDNSNPEPTHDFRPYNEHLSNKGIQSITNQTLRIFSHAGLHYHVKHLRRAHPQVDIILIEPQQNDVQMFFNNIMRYSARLMIAHHGFESVTYDLAKDYPYLKDTLSRHGIRISRRLVIEELNEIAQSGHDPEVIRKVLEASQVGCRQRHPKSPACKLSKVLSELESIIDDQLVDLTPASITLT